MKRGVLLAICAVVGVVVGILVSQYIPIFGGIEKFGEPWSPIRMSLIGSHVFLFAIIGVGAGFYCSRNKQ